MALFTSLLRREEPGAYTFGEIDQSQFTGDVTFTDIDPSRGFWSFTPESFSIGNEQFTTNPTSALAGIADTGTTLLLVDDAIVERYYSQVPSAELSRTAGAFVFDCDEALPSFSLNIPGYQAMVPGDFINFGVLLGTNVSVGFNLPAALGSTSSEMSSSSRSLLFLIVLRLSLALGLRHKHEQAGFEGKIARQMCRLVMKRAGCMPHAFACKASGQAMD